MSSDIVLSDLKLTPGPGSVTARCEIDDSAVIDKWYYLQLDRIEYHYRTTNDRDSGSDFVAGGNEATLGAQAEGQKLFWWCQGVDRSNQRTAWFPSGATAGIVGVAGFSAGAGQALTNGQVMFSINGSGKGVFEIKTLSGDDPSTENPVLVAFRNPSADDGSLVFRKIESAVSVTTKNNQRYTTNFPFRIWQVLVDDGGTFRLGLAVCTNFGSSSPRTNVITLTEYGLTTTEDIDTALSLGSGTIQTQDAVATPMPYRVLGYMDWDEESSPSWTDPFEVRRFGPGVALPGAIINSRSFYLEETDFETQSPLDGTFLQYAEGDVIATHSADDPATYTASSICNVLRAEVRAAVNLKTGEAADHAVLSLFRSKTDGTAGFATSAFVAMPHYFGAADQIQTICIDGVALAHTSDVTFELHGGSASGSSEFTLLGGGSYFGGGGRMSNEMRITEYMG